MKIRSFPDRDESHKRVKDVADLHALLWYVTDYADMKDAALAYVSDADLEAFSEAVDNQVFDEAATLLRVERELISNSITRLLRPA